MNRGTLIVVDDEQEICDIVREIAEVDGFRVLTATSAGKFQKLWQANHPAVLVIDIMMPKMNGLQLLHWLADEGCYDPVILMTGFGAKAMEMGEITGDITGENIIGILSKPLALDTFEELLKQASAKLGLVEWTDDMSVGVDALDHDHQKLFGLINELDAIINADVVLKQGAIDSVLSELSDYTNYHFNREEALMVACEYPELDNHKIVHMIYKNKIDQIIVEHKRQAASINLQETQDFLKDWWTDHIMVMDKGYQSWMQDKPSAIEKANAEFEHAGTGLYENNKQKRKLLVIDDEPDICDFVAYVGRQAGYETLVYSQADDFQTMGIDVIVLDLFMPGKDGVEIIRALADNNNQAAIILMSGHDAGVLHSAREIAVERGLHVMGSLSKPLSFDVLLALLLDIKLPEKKPVTLKHTLSLPQQELAKAIEAQEIIPFFQPKIRLATANVTGVEALARWQHPERGLISPALFIPLFEQHDLISDLTYLMLKQSLEQCGVWNMSGQRLKVSVNMSPSVLNDLEFPEQLMEQVTKNALEPSQIIIEVTETAVFTELVDSLDILTRLRMKGFHLSIDDYGTGYSSMQQLMRAPFSELKIDQSFVKHADTDEEARSICESTIELGHKLNMSVIAEGIETRAVWDLLLDAGCDDGQGYYIGKPMPADEFSHWLDEWNRKNENVAS